MWVAQVRILTLRFKNTESNLDRWLKQNAEKLLRKIGIEEGFVILDFGCGSGSYSIPAAKIVGQKGKIYALDKDENALNDLMHKAESFGLRNIEGMKTSGELEVDLKDGSRDAILLFDVFRELYFPSVGERRRLLQAFYRILKPNGLLIVHWCAPESKPRDEIDNSNSLWRVNILACLSIMV